MAGIDWRVLLFGFQEIKTFSSRAIHTQSDLPFRVGSFSYIEHQQGDNIEVKFMIIIYPFY
jgi:hypothetical protein